MQLDVVNKTLDLVNRSLELVNPLLDLCTHCIIREIRHHFFVKSAAGFIVCSAVPIERSLNCHTCRLIWRTMGKSIGGTSFV